MPGGPTGALPRSYLYCPGDQPGRLSRAMGRGSDAVIVDLEDSVHPSRKDEARSVAARWLASQPADSGEIWVRVNAGDLARDVGAVVTMGVRGLFLPKAEPAQLDALAAVLSERERELDLTPGCLRIVPVVETACGLQSADTLASAPRVIRLGLGEADLAAELGIDLRADPAIMNPLRLHVVVASAAARIAPPIGPASTDFTDLAALRASTSALAALGFRARTAIHPAQIAILHEVLAPSAEELARAREIVAAFDRADSDGLGVLAGPDGTMIDVAVVRAMREIIARAGADARPPADPAGGRTD